MMLLPIHAQDAVKAGFRGRILPLIGQFRHEPAGRQAGKFRAITDAWNRSAFVLAELVARLRPLGQGTPVSVNLTAFGPAPQGAFADLHLGTGFGTARASGDGLCDQQGGSLAM